ncbi:MAG: hypothetical protein V3U87_07665 [Methylococcaceae bacterium]
MKWKAKIIAEKCDERDKFGGTIRLSGSDKTKKGIMVKIPVGNVPVAPQNYFPSPTEVSVVSFL